MKIEHVALYVRELDLMKAFYEKYFNAMSNVMYHNPRTGLKTYFLSFEDGARLELMTRPDMASDEKELYQWGWTHLAFSVGSKEKVDNLTAELLAAGFEVLSGPRTTGDGYYESVVLDPEGNQLEITV